ncbi:unnamed protein product [Taenia asiatica]|uniref:Uncharacterized protein n=1 Tax=Taenia asiatica TaxID=60517 RepID=A0A0R3VXY3_TAEAS|nr:unnamed protein product [Taenia asiatica]
MCGNTAPSTSRADGREEDEKEKEDSSAQVWTKFSLVCCMPEVSSFNAYYIVVVALEADQVDRGEGALDTL